MDERTNNVTCDYYNTDYYKTDKNILYIRTALHITLIESRKDVRIFYNDGYRLNLYLFLQCFNFNSSAHKGSGKIINPVYDLISAFMCFNTYYIKA